MYLNIPKRSPTQHCTSKMVKQQWKVLEPSSWSLGPASAIEMIPDLKHILFISVNKFADANYFLILSPIKVLIYGDDGLKLEVSKEAVIWGLTDKDSSAWQ